MDFSSFDSLPAFSRNWNQIDDFDCELEDLQPKVEFDASGIELLKKESKFVLVIGVEGSGEKFLQSCLSATQKPVTQITISPPKKSSSFESSKKTAKGNFYSVEGKDGQNAVVLLFQNELSSEYCPTVVSQLFQTFKSKVSQVCVFDKLRPMHYISLDGRAAHPPLLRKLETSQQRKQTKFGGVKGLEAPNFVAGLSAAVLTQCQVEGLAAVGFFSYEDYDGVTLDSARAFAEVLKESTPLTKVLDYSAERLKKECAKIKLAVKAKAPGGNPLYL